MKLEAFNALPLIPTLHELDAYILLGAVKVAIKLLKNNKASGADGIPAEVLKCGGEALAAELHAVFELCWHTHCLPQDFKDANIITLYKNKGSRQDCNSYRGFSLLSVAGKVLSRVLLPRLQIIADRVLLESQCGFRASRSTIDAVFTLRQLQEKCIEQQCPLYVAFIDMTKAFDLVSRSGLFAILKRFVCPEKIAQHYTEAPRRHACYCSGQWLEISPFSHQTWCQAGVRSCSYPLCNFLYCTAHTCLFEAVWCIIALLYLWEIV